ncbi:cation transporter [Inquilinus limosus]|uniref:cation diffusion facilitator family transporter n=1 Tax=Inquilinus limosus TaxID=171674 RepID=UPI003F158143
MAVVEGTACIQVEPAVDGTASARQRERTARVAVLAVIPTLAVTAWSVLASNSLALAADLLLTVLDTACVLVAWIVARRALAERPAGLDYGTGKLESLASAVVGVFMVASLCLVTTLAALRLWQGGAAVAGSGVFAGLAINLVYGLVNGAILLRYRAQRRHDPSPLVQSQIRLFIDKVTSNLLMAAALGGAVLFRDTAIGPYIDPVASLLVALSMAFWAVQIIRSSIGELIDAACGEDVRRPLAAALARCAGGFGDPGVIRTRRAGGVVYVEIELGCAQEISVAAIERLRIELMAMLRPLIPALSVAILPRPLAAPAGPRLMAAAA